jgi:hypothetical protein
MIVVSFRAFIIHVPFAVLCITIISLKLHDDKDRSPIVTDPTYGTIEETIEESKIEAAESKSKPFDLVGLAFLITAIVSLLCFVQLAEAQEMENKSMILTILGATFLTCSVIFCVNEAYWTQEPLLPLSLLSLDKLGLSYTAQLFIGLASYAVCSPRPLLTRSGRCVQPGVLNCFLTNYSILYR